MKYNLHTHSKYCGHGSGTIGEYAEYALEKGFDLLGFSEHCPFPNDFYHSTRMSYSKMKDYESDVKAIDGYGSRFLLGYECDYFKRWRSYFEEIKERVDYLIAGVHLIVRPNGEYATPFTSSFSSKDLPLYVDSYTSAMETGLFSFMAHPDVFLLHCKWDENAISASRDIIVASKELGIPLEVNANGIIKAEKSGSRDWGYPNRNFWLLAKEYGIKAVCSSDAHEVENLDKHYDDVHGFVNSIALDCVEPKFDRGKLVFK